MASLLLVLALLPVQDDAPSGTLTLNGGAKATRLASVRAEVKLVSSGAGEVQLSLTVGNQEPSWVPFRGVSFVDLVGADGEKTVTLRLRDKSGRESSPVTATLRLDTVPPVLKVEAPERVAGFELPLRIESADAVGMQYTENLASWSAWEAFTTPKTIALSKGAGAKQVFVRVRDEAGNESVPARLRVDTQDPTAPSAPDGIRSVSLGLRRHEESLELTIWVYGENLRELQAELDGKPVLDRMPFVPSWKILVAPMPGPRRLTVKAWDSAGREHHAEAVFVEGDVPALPPAEEVRNPWRVDFLAGVLPMGVAFDSRTSVGDREIKRTPMAVVRLQAAWAMGAHLYLQAGAEVAAGSEVLVYSGGLDFGVRMNLGNLWDTPLELRTEAGLYYSKLQVTQSQFGSFDPGPLVRVAATLAAQIGESLWAQVLLDVRYAWYRYDGSVAFGDKTAGELSGALMFGLSWRF
jgi:hypothetical protein